MNILRELLFLGVAIVYFLWPFVYLFIILIPGQIACWFFQKGITSIKTAQTPRRYVQYLQGLLFIVVGFLLIGLVAVGVWFLPYFFPGLRFDG